MKCPQCRREIAYVAVWCRCGWRATVSAHTTAPPSVATPKVPERMPPLRADIREKLDVLLKKSRVKAQLKRALEERTSADLTEATPGHGRHCFCELCWPVRMRRMSAPQPESATEERHDNAK